MPTTEPNTRAPAVHAVATVFGRVTNTPLPGVGEEGLAWMSRPRIAVIDFYPANQPTTEGATRDR